MDYNKAAEVFLTTVIKRGKAEMMHRFNTYSQGEHLVLGYLYKEAGSKLFQVRLQNLRIQVLQELRQS